MDNYPITCTAEIAEVINECFKLREQLMDKHYEDIWDALQRNFHEHCRHIGVMIVWVSRFPVKHRFTLRTTGHGRPGRNQAEGIHAWEGDANNG